MNMRRISLVLALVICSIGANARITVSEKQSAGSFPLRGAKILVSPSEQTVVLKAAQMFAGDCEAVFGTGAAVGQTLDFKGNHVVVIGTLGHNDLIDGLVEAGAIDVSAIRGGWEQYLLTVVDNPVKGIGRALVVVGSDRRGAAYGILSLSEAIGVSPFVWWTDVPVGHKSNYYVSGTEVSKSPSVKYRGIFINDEDWGLKPWAAFNYEKELGDIGPKTYARVCELILRLKGNMLAPAMHSCTGAFYSHPESKLVADQYGIIITTSHCEPLLLNNAAKSEWDSDRDGDWNYATNKETIIRKWEDRLSEASQFENLYTVAMRGVHDAGLRGNLPMNERVQLLNQVISDQRSMLERHIGKKAGEIPQIFVPYKETMDVYENGLQVPEDIIIVWVDDNYGYMKKVSGIKEKGRKGGSGVYYHISYLGAPHDYLWLNTTPPALMYEELRKAYDEGADRYWLLNVGDIKPGELALRTFFSMAWNFDGYGFDDANSSQPEFLAGIFGEKYLSDFRSILDEYYRLAWSRKPEYMGWEREWDSPEYTGLKDTEYSFANYSEAQRRLADYQKIADRVNSISGELQPKYRDSFFELLQYPVNGAFQINRKFLMAQLNHEMTFAGRLEEAEWAACESEAAFKAIEDLTAAYNVCGDGKWQGIMELAPAFNALYQNMPEVIHHQGVSPNAVDLSVKDEPHTGCMVLDLIGYSSISGDAEIVEGLGYDWKVIRLGHPKNANTTAAVRYILPKIDADTVSVTVYSVPFFPKNDESGNRYSFSFDGNESVIANEFIEYSLGWKDQVLQNGKEHNIRLAIDRDATLHEMVFKGIDPGMMVQRVVVDWGGLKKTYIK